MCRGENSNLHSVTGGTLGDTETLKLSLYHGEKKKKKTSNGNFKLNFDGLFDSLSEFSVAGFVVHN